MTRILLTLEYDGTDFAGWQIQPEQRTVQGVTEAALSALFGAQITLKASGRTDAGVHALAQKAHFDVERLTFSVEKLPQALNVKLPKDVSVTDAQIVADDFEARFSAKKKTYRYSFYFGRVHRPLYDRYAARVPYPESRFDEIKAQRALETIVGVHDFTAFSSTGRPVADGTRTVYEGKMEKNGDIYSITVEGNGFLYNMVRIIAGTVIEVGLGLLPLSNVALALSNPDRTLLGKTFPPCGLTLVSVDYNLD